MHPHRIDSGPPPPLAAVGVLLASALFALTVSGALASEATVGGPQEPLRGGESAGERRDGEGLEQRLRRLEAARERSEAQLERQREEIVRLRSRIDAGVSRQDASGQDAPGDSDGGPREGRAGAKGTIEAGGSPERDLFEPPGAWTPRGDTAVTRFDLPEHLSLGFGAQYRLMYDASDIPGPGGSTLQRTRGYDLLRQRLRLNLALAPRGVRAGGLVQVEFRGGFGGSSPNGSDPRSGEPTLNPFNRLSARGVRYGYLFAEPLPEQRIIAGILPLSDRFGDTLFSADWDFNTGGAALLGAWGPASYRVGYLRLIDGVSASAADTVAEEGSLVLLDLEREFRDGLGGLETLTLGAHAYWLHVGEGLPLGSTEELWVGPTLAATVGELELEGFAIANAGRLGTGVLDADGRVVSGFDTADGHVGYALKVAASHPLGPVKLALQALVSSGDGDGRVQDRFVTPEGLLGTEGYWAFNHIFTARPASDTSDLGLELGNAGAGLWTLQARAEVPIVRWLSGELSGGWFRAMRSRNGSRDLGVEVAASLTVTLADGLQLDLGGAGAFLGDFFGRGADDLYEVFARAQFQF